MTLPNRHALGQTPDLSYGHTRGFKRGRYLTLPGTRPFSEEFHIQARFEASGLRLRMRQVSHRSVPPCPRLAHRTDSVCRTRPTSTADAAVAPYGLRHQPHPRTIGGHVTEVRE
jgi:hypothetical protein